MLLTLSKNWTKEENNDPMNTHGNALNGCIVSARYSVKHTSIFNKRSSVLLNNWNAVKKCECAYLKKVEAENILITAIFVLFLKN